MKMSVLHYKNMNVYECLGAETIGYGKLVIMQYKQYN